MIQCEFFSFFGIVVNQDSRPHATGQKSLFQVRLQSAETKMTNSSMLAETNSEYRETVGVGVAARNRGDPESTPAGSRGPATSTCSL